jgi:hypothetical protein
VKPFRRRDDIALKHCRLSTAASAGQPPARGQESPMVYSLLLRFTGFVALTTLSTLLLALPYLT